MAAPACDCERALLTLRNVLTIATTVTAIVAVLTGVVAAVPVIVRRFGPIGFLLGSVGARLLRTDALQRLTNQSDAIEGVFFRVREEVIFLEQEIARSTGRTITREVLPRA